MPMINAEGVIIGNNRTSLSGNDLDRVFDEPDKYAHPEIFNFRNMIYHLIDDKNIIPFMYLNMGGHLHKKNFFVYSNYF